ncbi:MAG: aldehyde ferredoxin oxidoreductase [Deltaproteobacteria bacterium]|nr:aldehyde ferredoxin oxidoreductase [Deltaproteobacteria bacterium]
MAKIIRVDLTQKTIYSESVPDKYFMLGGRGLTSQIIFDEMDPNCDALGKNNKLVIAPGLLTGTPAPSSARLSIGAKSPLTGGIKESNAGGTVARKLANLGIKAIILEGKPEFPTWHLLKITNIAVMILSAEDIVGLGNYDTVSRLQAVYGPKVGIMSIGPGGERKMGAATIAITDPEGRPCRHCGRGGLGAVMGSKGIKAVVIDDKGADEQILSVSDLNGFNEVSRTWAKAMVQAKVGLTTFGTAALVGPVSAAGGLATRNYSTGNFEGADKFNGAALAETVKSRGGRTGHACSPGCVIRCSNIYHDKEGKYLTAGLEFETIVLMGSNLGIDSLDVIAALDRRCDDYGLDTMEMGNAIGVAMEAGVAAFGDGKAALNLLDEAGKGTVLGRVLGQGAAITGRVFGVTHVAVSKGQGMAAYDPRALKGTGVTYATSPMGADHTAGNLIPGRAGVDCHSPEGQIKASRDLQIMSTVIDNMGLCLFVGPLPPEMEIISQLLTKALGRLFSVEEVLEIGKGILRTEFAFNRAAGFNKANDRLPEFFRVEKLSPRGLVFDVSDKEIDQVHSAL